MKRAIAVVVAVGIALGLSACGSAKPAGDDQLVVWGWRTDAPWEKLVESYGESSGVKVDYRSYQPDEYNSVLQNGLSSSSGPDIVMLRSYGGLETLVAGGQIAALDEDSPALAKLSDEVIDGARSHADGKIYGVPFQTVTANIIYNTAIFDKLGLSEPTTWDEFIAVNDALAAAGVTPMAAGALDSWILPIYRDLFGSAVYGGEQFATDIDAGTTDFTDPKYTAANQVLADLTKYFPKGFEGLSYEDAKSVFASGEAAMYPGGIWELAGLKAAMPDVKLGLFNPPAITGGDTPAVGYVDGSFGMSARLKGDKRGTAEGFLNWVGSEPFGQAIADDLLSLPVVQGVVPADPLLARATDAFAANPASYLTYVHFDYGTPSGTTLEYDNLQKLLIGSITADQVGTAVQQGISQWFKPAK